MELIPLAAPKAIADRKSSYTFKVTNSEWVDTGVQLAAGDHVEWSASGTMKVSDGREVTADGLARGWKDLIRQFPMNNANTGALVARIGDAEAVPFLIGTKSDLSVLQTGRLYLAANLSSDLRRRRRVRCEDQIRGASEGAEWQREGSREWNAGFRRRGRLDERNNYGKHGRKQV